MTGLRAPLSTNEHGDLWVEESDRPIRFKRSRSSTLADLGDCYSPDFVCPVEDTQLIDIPLRMLTRLKVCQVSADGAVFNRQGRDHDCGAQRK